MFCDEIILVKDKPSWYSGGATNAGFGHKAAMDIEWGPMRQVFSSISNWRVVEKFKHRKIHICESAYNKFHALELPKDLLVCEVRAHDFLREPIASLGLPMAVGIDYQFQKNLIETVGEDNYMSTQILASKYLNWQFFCVCGSANLFSVIPAKSIFLRDGLINQSVKSIVKRLSPHAFWPACFEWTDRGFEKYIDYDNVMNAFKEMSAVEVDFEIVLIRGF